MDTTNDRNASFGKIGPIGDKQPQTLTQVTLWGKISSKLHFIPLCAHFDKGKGVTDEDNLYFIRIDAVITGSTHFKRLATPSETEKNVFNDS